MLLHDGGPDSRLGAGDPAAMEHDHETLRGSPIDRVGPRIAAGGLRVPDQIKDLHGALPGCLALEYLNDVDQPDVARLAAVETPDRALEVRGGRLDHAPSLPVPQDPRQSKPCR